MRLRAIQQFDRNRWAASHQTGVYWKIQTAASALEASEWDAAAACLGEARSALAGLTGQNPGEDLLDRVFGEFCIGK